MALTRFFGWEPDVVDRLTTRELLRWNDAALRLAADAHKGRA